MRITFFPANNGDSFFLETASDSILIDGGYVSTYKKYIKPKLLQLKKENRSLNHLIVTHIDNDHISGIIKFIEENTENKIAEVENVWHNSYSHLKSIDDGLNFSGKSIDTMSINYQLMDEEDLSSKNISAVQGSTLASLLKKNNFQSKNDFFNNHYISFDTAKVIECDDVIFRILSPDDDKLLELKKYWKKELFNKGFSSDQDLSDFNEEFFEYILSLEKEKKRLRKKNISASEVIDVEALAEEDFSEDDTATNGSSIAFVLEYNKLRLLFLSDSHPSIVAKNIKEHYKEETFPIKFDLIKISHHGSKNNTCPELLELIDSEKYMISTNGVTHKHPDLETIARIIQRKSTFTRNIYVNYDLDSLKSFENDDLEKKYNYKMLQNKTNNPIIFDL
ncbi:MBL fold metallo-hydrolase [Chryseobacterium sp. LC2016-27]|uniref:MBL fold metallo-hydrolase n=1 Tax=Chryseobacterium sp. LC2016-27 TaxID=2897326 RepID=UPI001E2EBADD|nr:MBL fold metallo-hydrolase [Chryseobacterium sp. LC2016-27]MCD0456276.1 MBL fold metallo-hydrolase [Chryseobacterium sp. LC2016-27]